MNQLTVTGRDVWYVDRGTGVPLLLVHGFPLDHSMWTEQIAPLSQHARVLAPDLRGFGRSPAAGATVTMGEFADDLLALLDGLRIQEPVVLCGLSMGGYIAFQFAAKYAARLRGLILCDTRAAADTPDAAASRLKLADQVLRDGSRPLVETMLPRLLAPATSSERPAILGLLSRVVMDNSPQGIAAALRGMAERADMTATLEHIPCPTLVLVGEQDALSTPDEMRRMADAIPQSRFVAIPRAGHLAPLENPAAANAAISDFLATL